jgi:hypothetical protein
MPDTVALLQESQAKLTQNPELYGHLRPASEEAVKLMQETTDRGLPYAAGLREEMTHITQSLKSPQADTLRQMDSGETDQLVNYALGGSKGGGERLETMRKLMPEEQWETCKQSVLNKSLHARQVTSSG